MESSINRGHVGCRSSRENLNKLSLNRHYPPYIRLKPIERSLYTSRPIKMFRVAADNICQPYIPVPSRFLRAPPPHHFNSLTERSTSSTTSLAKGKTYQHLHQIPCPGRPCRRTPQSLRAGSWSGLDLRRFPGIIIVLRRRQRLVNLFADARMAHAPTAQERKAVAVTLPNGDAAQVATSTAVDFVVAMRAAAGHEEVGGDVAKGEEGVDCTSEVVLAW